MMTRLKGACIGCKHLRLKPEVDRVRIMCSIEGYHVGNRDYCLEADLTTLNLLELMCGYDPGEAVRMHMMIYDRKVF